MKEDQRSCLTFDEREVSGDGERRARDVVVEVEKRRNPELSKQSISSERSSKRDEVDDGE